MATTIIVYILIIRMVIKSSQMKSSATSKHSWKAVKMTLMVVGVYLAAGMPFVFARLYTTARDTILPLRVRMFTTVIYMLNTAVSPYMILLTNKSLRHHGETAIRDVTRKSLNGISSSASNSGVGDTGDEINTTMHAIRSAQKFRTAGRRGRAGTMRSSTYVAKNGGAGAKNGGAGAKNPSRISLPETRQPNLAAIVRRQPRISTVQDVSNILSKLDLSSNGSCPTSPTKKKEKKGKDSGKFDFTTIKEVLKSASAVSHGSSGSEGADLKLPDISQ